MNAHESTRIKSQDSAELLIDDRSGRAGDGSRAQKWTRLPNSKTKATKLIPHAA